MNQSLTQKLRIELAAFEQLEPGSSAQSISDCYERILSIVQTMMLEPGNPAVHDRAWGLLNDDVFKDLDQIQQGNGGSFEDLKLKISQIGHLLLNA